MPGPVADAAAITIAATLGTAPLMALHFEQVSLAALPANLLAAPAIAPVMWLGVLAAARGAARGAAGRAVLGADRAAARLPAEGRARHRGARRCPSSRSTRRRPRSPPAWPALLVGRAARRAGGGGWRARARGRGRPSRAAPAPDAARADAARGRRDRRWRRRCSSSRSRPARCARAAPRGRASSCVSFLDIGQGDATLIQLGGTSVLVDTGPPDGPILKRLDEAGRQAPGRARCSPTPRPTTRARRPR